MTALLECIPNVSEGRSERTVAYLAEPFGDTEGVALLHTHADPDHHRSVFTVVGRPEALLTALARLYERAVETIDMRAHRGVHPRLGAVDVCPFVPLPRHGSDMATCVEISRRLGARIAERLDLPVIHYRDAATDPARVDLTDIRRGQFEGLADKLARPEWKPDHGPARPHPSAGATVIGARGPLVAYNAVLDSDDLELARTLARLVRESSGGLVGIKAMGVPLASRGLVQVSMNVQRPDITPVHVVVDRVREAAAERGVDVLETELVGLMPLSSVTGAAAHHLRLPELPDELVLEEAITRTGLSPR